MAGGRSYQLAIGKRPVSEANRISIMDRLQEFRNSDLQQMQFEAGLNNHDRAVVHEFCKKMGFKSKSYGKGEQRRVTVFKPTGFHATKGPAAATPIKFSQETHQILQELFLRFPPTENEGEITADMYKVASIDRSFAKPEKVQCLKMTPADISQQLSALAKRRQTDRALQQIHRATARLPISSYRDIITATVDRNQIVIIAGETGCGKSTQVPQYLLDHMWSQQKACRIVCTQPRRISATSVADRVATERGEKIGDTVGYQIRLESKGGPRSSLMFCTNGILLRKLVDSRQGPGALSTIKATHIIVDEIHERDCNADFLLIILKDILPSQPHLRLVLMSATMDAELFSTYFHGCPILKIPGFTHPVQVYHLEDVLALTNYNAANVNVQTNSQVGIDEIDTELEAAMTCAWLENDFEPLITIVTESPTPEVFDYQHSITGVTPLMVAAGKGRTDDISLLLSLGANCALLSCDGETALDWAEKFSQDQAADLIRDHLNEQAKLRNNKESELLGLYHKTANQEEVDVSLIRKLLLKICEEPQGGAILVFLPGWEDITRCRDCLLSSPIFSDGARFLVLPLHSMVPMSEQKRVFCSLPPHVRKIVLATNIAETSITIDDVVYVIDSGRMKEKSYDPYTNVSTFQTAWISKASARQRQGRAGRCQPGVCYRLFSKLRAAALIEFQVPEMKRTPLEELCLKVKLLQPSGSIRDFLAKALDPPLDISIKNAVKYLQNIGAVNSSEELTELGKQLGSLPVHPATSKMLLLAILLNCLDPALTIASAAGYREPFVLPINPAEKKQAFAVKHRFALPYGGFSDHLALVAAFEEWQEAKKRNQDSRFCAQKFISPGVMFMLDGMRKQLLGELVQRGFVSRDNSCSLNAGDPGIVRAVLSSYMYPMVGKFLPLLKGQKKVAIQVAKGEKVRVHPHSANFRLAHSKGRTEDIFNEHLVIFDEITRGEAQVFVRNSTLIKPHPLLFICSELSVAPLDFDSGSDDEKDLMDSPEKALAMVIDRWLQYETTSGEAAQIYCLRERLLAAYHFKVRHPRANLPESLAASVYALACLLSYEGALSIPDIDYGASMIVSGRKQLQAPKNMRQQQQQQQPQRQAQQTLSKQEVTARSFSNSTGANNKNSGSSSGRTYQQQTRNSTSTKYVAKTRP